MYRAYYFYYIIIMTKQECERILDTVEAAAVALQININTTIYDARVDVIKHGLAIKNTLSEINNKLAIMLAITHLLREKLTKNNIEKTIESVAEHAYIALNTLLVDVTQLMAELIVCSIDDGYFDVLDYVVEDFNDIYDHVLNEIDDYVTYDTRELVKVLVNPHSDEDLV